MLVVLMTNMEKHEKYFDGKPIEIIEFEGFELGFESGTSRSIRMQNMSAVAQYFEGVEGRSIR